MQVAWELGLNQLRANLSRSCAPRSRLSNITVLRNASFRHYLHVPCCLLSCFVHIFFNRFAWCIIPGALTLHCIRLIMQSNLYPVIKNNIEK